MLLLLRAHSKHVFVVYVLLLMYLNCRVIVGFLNTELLQRACIYTTALENEGFIMHLGHSLQQVRIEGGIPPFAQK
jgi:hypothetical protein